MLVEGVEIYNLSKYGVCGFPTTRDIAQTRTEFSMIFDRITCNARLGKY